MFFQNSYYRFLVLHAAMVCAGFLLALAGILVARTKPGGKKWLVIHRRLMSFGVGCFFIGLVLGVSWVQSSWGGHLLFLHAWLALTGFLLMAGNLVLGYRLFKKAETAKRKRFWHRWIGRTALVVMAFTIYSGLLRSGFLPFF